MPRNLFWNNYIQLYLEFVIFVPTTIYVRAGIILLLLQPKSIIQRANWIQTWQTLMWPCCISPTRLEFRPVHTAAFLCHLGSGKNMMLDIADGNNFYCSVKYKACSGACQTVQHRAVSEMSETSSTFSQSEKSSFPLQS